MCFKTCIVEKLTKWLTLETGVFFGILMHWLTSSDRLEGKVGQTARHVSQIRWWNWLCMVTWEGQCFRFSYCYAGGAEAPHFQWQKWELFLWFAHGVIRDKMCSKTYFVAAEWNWFNGKNKIGLNLRELRR